MIPNSVLPVENLKPFREKFQKDANLWFNEHYVRLS